MKKQKVLAQKEINPAIDTEKKKQTCKRNGTADP